MRTLNLISDSEDESEEEIEDANVSDKDAQDVSTELAFQGALMDIDKTSLRSQSTSTPETYQNEASSGRSQPVPSSSSSRSPSPYERLAPRPFSMQGRAPPILATSSPPSGSMPSAGSPPGDLTEKAHGDKMIPAPPSTTSPSSRIKPSSQNLAPSSATLNPSQPKPKLHPLFASTTAMYQIASKASQVVGRGVGYGIGYTGSVITSGSGGSGIGNVKKEAGSMDMIQGIKAEPSGTSGNSTIDQASATEMNPTSGSEINAIAGPSSFSQHEQTSTIPSENGGPIIEEKIVLSEEQEKVLGVAMRGESMFFTGSAGTGKSVLLRAIIQSMRNTPILHPDGTFRTRSVAVTASTGIAGLNVGGCTLHAWAGVGLGEEPPHVLYKKILQRGRARPGSKSIKLRVPGSLKSKSRFGGRAGQMEDVQAGSALARWLMDDVLIIDEISMIDGRLFDKLEQIGRMVRGKQEPFGGIQVILCGDFFQLPPVPDRHTKTSVFAFQAESWETCVPNMFTLKKVFRQKNQNFADMLNEARMGVCSPRSSRRFASLERVVEYNDGIQATELFPMRYQAENANQNRLNALGGDSIMYNAMDIPGRQADGSMYTFPEAVKLLDQHSRAPQTMMLKVGAQVMLTTNLSPTLANGSLGKVVGFEEVVAANTDKNAKGGDEEEGYARFRKSALPEPKQVPQIASRWPVVEFAGGNRMVIPSHDFDVMSVTCFLEARRVQVPLILAWALSIHKAQGITLPRMKVDLEKIFEKGQAYVALSRATSMDTLELQHFKPSKIYAHPAVIEWSKSLSAVSDE